jgi:aryl-alcohol dehydrogenase-like predicted oxidoreductase
MKLRPLGRSGLQVAPLAFGGNVFGWTADEATSHALLDAFVAGGGNLIDTADVYSAWAPGHAGGESESMLGRWLQRRGASVRERVLVATKVGKWAQRPGLKPDNIRAACDDSLRRLGIDCIDLYQAHEDDASVPLADTLGAFARLIEAGKVRAIGASNYSAARLAEALAVSSRHHLPRYESVQPEYHLMARAGYERELEPLVRGEGLGMLGYYALASGFLTGKYRSAADLPGHVRGDRVRRYLDARGLRVLAALDAVAARHRTTPAPVALAWQMARPGVTAPLASATRLPQLEELLRALHLQLAAEDIAELDAASLSS